MKLLNMKSIKFLKKEDQLSSLGDLLSAWQLGCPSAPEVRVDERFLGTSGKMVHCLLLMVLQNET